MSSETMLEEMRERYAKLRALVLSMTNDLQHYIDEAFTYKTWIEEVEYLEEQLKAERARNRKHQAKP